MAGSYRFKSGTLELAGHLATPPARHQTGTPAVVLCHSFRAGEGGAPSTAFTHPQLADRIANELGWIRAVVHVPRRGRLRRAVLPRRLADGHSRRHRPHRRATRCHGCVGGRVRHRGRAVPVCRCSRQAGQRCRRARGSGGFRRLGRAASPPARARPGGRSRLRPSRIPPSFDAWVHDLRAIRPLQCVAEYAPRTLLVVHGTDDDLVPDFDARVIADAHGSAEMRILAGASHQLRDDPRAVAVLLGWLDRERHVS